jgi:uncharacterized protein (TIGR01244 family)
MNARTTLLIIIATLVPGVSTPADQEQSASARVLLDRSSMPIEVKGVEGVERNLFLDGRVYIGGQPSEAALARLRELGVTAVVNLRTPSEMDDRTQVPYDEAEAVDRLGMEYVWVPLGGEEHPYTPDAVDTFVQVLDRHEGRVFLHCTMGWRASYLWVAYLVRSEGFALGDALARGRAIAIGPSPLEGLLGRPLELSYAQ